MKQKSNLEYYAVQNFIREYNKTHKRQFAFGAQHEPPFPDTICKLNNSTVGIEVVHTFGTDEEAAIRLGDRPSSYCPDKKHLDRRIIPVDIRAFNGAGGVGPNAVNLSLLTLARKPGASFRRKPESSVFNSSGPRLSPG